MKALTTSAGRKLRATAITAAALLALPAAALVPSVATASTLTVYPCGVPDGSLRPGTGDGITVADNGGSYGWMNTSDNCRSWDPTLMGLAHLPSGYQTYHWNGDGSWFATAAPNTSIARATYHRSPWGLHSGLFWDLYNGSGYRIDHASSWYGQTQVGWTSIAVGGSNRIQGRFFCNLIGGLTCQGPEAGIRIRHLELTINDNHAPAFTAQPTGSLFAAGKATGIKGVGFSATDVGSGVYKAELRVDGRVVETVYPDLDGGRCRKPFEYMRPCKLAVSHSFQFDTRTLVDGAHEVQVLVTDATEESRAVSNPTTVTTENRPANTTAPEIRGSPAVGHELEATSGGWTRNPTSISLQWMRCDGSEPGSCRPIVGANTVRYSPTAADAYRRLAVQATATNASGSETSTSSLSAIVADSDGFVDPTPTNHAAPAWSSPVAAAEPRPGSVLQMTPGEWRGPGPLAFSFRFKRCESGTCETLADGPAAAYTVTAADVGARITAEVTAANEFGSASAVSVGSGVVVASRDADGRDGGDDRRGGVDDGSRRGGEDDGRGPTAPDPPKPVWPIEGLVNPIAGPGHVANGMGASENARLRVLFEVRRGKKRRSVATVTSRRDQRQVIRGQLLNSGGRAIAGAKLVTTWQLARSGRWVAKTGVTTLRDGRFVYILPKGPSRKVRFVFFAFSDSTSYSESNTLNQRVLTPVSIKASPRSTSNGRTVRFSGAVARDGIPSTGVLVTLEARYPGAKWKQFKVVRTTKTGRYTAAYRFTSTSRRTVYSFRARVAKQGSYPFDGGTSRPTKVTVTP